MQPGIADMTSGTLEFEGTRYLDGSASDPNLLGWMQGAPPADLKRIRFEDDKFLKFPEIRWSLSHVRELLPTVPVWRGSGARSDLGGLAPEATAAAIDALTFDDLHGRRLTWAQSLLDTYTDGIVVLHRGRRLRTLLWCAAAARHARVFPSPNPMRDTGRDAAARGSIG
jgi:hypothetical protein